MPAVQRARLQQQAARLSEFFDDPLQYVHELENLLQSFMVQVNRKGRVKGARPVLHTYETPAPVIKQLQLELSLQARQRPNQALLLADALWERRTIETRTLAARLLGVIHAADLSEVTRRLEFWAQDNREPILAPVLAEQATLDLVTHPEEFIAFVDRLLKSRELRQQVLALGALRKLLQANHFSNLPLLFALLNPYVADPSKAIRPYLVTVLCMLAERSPSETTFFLQQVVRGKATEGTQWIVRQVQKTGLV